MYHAKTKFIGFKVEQQLKKALLFLSAQTSKLSNEKIQALGSTKSKR